MTYATIGRRAQRVSQVAFLRLLGRGLAYQIEAPTLWDVDFRTAVAQAELEDRERDGAYHRVRFDRPDGGVVEIETTRPELLPSCVALVAHPDDERYRPLFGSHVRTPLFGVRVPVKAHVLADPGKGSGIAMICTFGDTTDVVWWRELALPVRAVIQPDGTLRPVTWGEAGWESEDAAAAQASYNQLAGLSAVKARARIADQLREAGALVGEPRPITHHVKFYEKGDRPLEVVTSRQWFIRTMDFKDALLARDGNCGGTRYITGRTNWVNGLNGDWCISVVFSVPFALCRLGTDGAIASTRPSSTRRAPDRSSTGVPKAGGPGAARPGGSRPNLTSWTPGPPRR
jgi:valyl-tRNA synthetase